MEAMSLGCPCIDVLATYPSSESEPGLQMANPGSLSLEPVVRDTGQVWTT